MRFLLIGLSLICVFTSPPTIGSERTAVDLAIVIDDVGYNKQRGLRAISLPAPVTIAILPFAPHTQSLAAATKRVGKDLIIHQPMEAIPSPHVRLEEDTLTTAMTPAQFDSAVTRAIAAVPESLGFSNHTGSLLTTQREPMQRFMRHLQARNLVFLDSRTTASTVAVQVADELGVTALRRDVFLDHERSTHAIEAAFNKAVRLARNKGHAILVGHPYPITLSFLEKALASPPEGINLVGLEALALKRRSLKHSALRRLEELALEPRPENLHISLGQ